MKKRLEAESSQIHDRLDSCHRIGNTLIEGLTHVYMERVSTRFDEIIYTLCNQRNRSKAS
jgi:hypothetical protein